MLPPPVVPAAESSRDATSGWVSARSKMWNSSIVASRNGSPYWERPIHRLPGLPRLDGFSVMAVLAPDGCPLTYRVPVLPDRVTATCTQAPTGSAAEPSIRCSAPEPPTVMANRGTSPVTPARGVRNMLMPVDWPKSNSRVQLAVEPRLIQVAMVKSVSWLIASWGSVQYCALLVPFRRSALPNLPGTRPMTGAGSSPPP